MGTNDSQERSGLSRRELLKRSAVAGGVVWATPTVLASAAGATSTVNCPTGSCPTLHIVKLDNKEQPIPTNANGSQVTCGNFFVDLGDGGSQCQFSTGGYTVSDTTCAQFNSHLLKLENNVPGYPGNSIRITLKPGYQFVEGFSKKGGPVNGKQCPGEKGGPFVRTGCSTATFSANSHIEFSYCGPS